MEINHNGHAMTGRDPALLGNLIHLHGDEIWAGPDSDANGFDRGDRHYRPDLIQTHDRRLNEGKHLTMTEAPKMTGPQALKLFTDTIRTVMLRRPAIDPIDSSAPLGTQHRRISAYNALFDLARPGRHKYCGYRAASLKGPCVLKDGHADSKFDDTTAHMDVEQRDRAVRYLVHSEPDPARRA